MSKPFHYQVEIKENMLDVFGHLNNANYLVLFEEARWEILHESKYGLEEIERQKIGPVIVELNLKYKKELSARDRITIVSHAEAIEKSSKLFHIYQKMLKADESIAAEAVFTVGYMDLVSRKLVTLQDEWLKIMGIK